MKEKISQYSAKDPIFKKTLKLLNYNERRNLFLLLILSLITAVAQTAGIALFLPFMNLLINLNSIYNNKYLNWVFTKYKFSDAYDFVIVVGVAVGVMILLSNAFAIMNNLAKSRYILNCSHKLSRRMLKHYLYSSYEYFLKRNPSELLKNAMSDTNEYVSNYLNSIIDLIINSFMILLILAMLLFIDPLVTSFVVGFFILIYGGLTLFSKTKLKKSGIKVMNATRDKQKYAYEALNGFKISKSMGIEDYFVDRYTSSSKKVVKYSFLSKALQEIPRNVIEALVFCGLSAAIVIIILEKKDLNLIIPKMSVYVVAGYRIMPEVAKIFSSISKILHHLPVVDRLYEEMYINGTILELYSGNDQMKEKQQPLNFSQNLILDNVSFSYDQDDQIIKNLTLNVPVNSIIGFAGATGAGKTTLIDIIMGLLVPQVGQITVDDQQINQANVRLWREKIGYVPQDIYLIDDTIVANIAFGVKKENIDIEKVRKAAHIAAISDFIENELSDQYNTIVGDRGTRLSGGQRQRIGLARALYRDPEILVLDEATSALDGATEESVVNSIHSESKVKTIIIIAHRLNTLMPCNTIYLMDHGQIIESGTYNELITKSDRFRRMAKIDR